MKLEGEQYLNADPMTVWAALFDREVLAAAIPGCESLEQTSDTEFAAVVKLKVGPVSARFKGDVVLSDIVPGQSCTLSGKGTGGIAGFAKGAAQVTLTPEGAGVRLRYDADVAVGGKLASLGSRLIKSTAQKLTDAFFANFSENLAVPEAAGPA
ncbi:CoxG family protein [Leisingera sp. XS_AS12]|uniref:CoxG family protein n=1 Tax=Leisingera sp. XS_AS12 TaxID=3241294 RepID=UPI0035121648